jgi:hypothetical protein
MVYVTCSVCQCCRWHAVLPEVRAPPKTRYHPTSATSLPSSADQAVRTKLIKVRYNTHRPHRALNQAAPLRPLRGDATHLDTSDSGGVTAPDARFMNIAWWHRFSAPTACFRRVHLIAGSVATGHDFVVRSHWPVRFGSAAAGWAAGRGRCKS